MPVVEYNSGSGTVAWSTVDPTANAFDVEIWGGGAGGVSSTSISHSGGGGGGGGYSKKRYFGRIGTYTYSVGTGGGNGNPSGDGGATTFQVQTANGGSGGLNQFGGAGGTASGGDTNTTAAAGADEGISSGGSGGDGANASFTGGAGATGSTPAGNGLQPGGGGGGGTTTGTPNNPGGTGGAGLVRITSVAGVNIQIGNGGRWFNCDCPSCETTPDNPPGITLPCCLSAIPARLTATVFSLNGTMPWDGETVQLDYQNVPTEFPQSEHHWVGTHVGDMCGNGFDGPPYWLEFRLRYRADLPDQPPCRWQLDLTDLTPTAKWCRPVGVVLNDLSYEDISCSPMNERFSVVYNYSGAAFTCEGCGWTNQIPYVIVTV